MRRQGQISASTLAGCIDHTLLKPEAGAAAVEQLCGEVVQYGFATACVHPWQVRRAAELLSGASSGVCSTVGFPLGTNHTKVKEAEAVGAIEDGATELDMVINLAAAQEGDMGYVRRDVEAVWGCCRRAKPAVVLKVILETAVLGSEAKIGLCQLLSELGVDFVKTSTGFHPAGGATVEDVQLLWAHRGGCKVKAAGGIRDLRTALAMLDAGAERIGTSSGVAIMKELLGGE